MSRRRLQGVSVAVLVAVTASLVAVSSARTVGAAIDVKKVIASCKSPDAKAGAAKVATSKYKKSKPWVLGVSAGYMSKTSWIAYFNQELKYEASRNKQYSKVVVLDAGFNASKQISDIQDLITQKVSGIIYWPVNQSALKGVLAKAEAAGIPTVESAIGFTKMGTSSVDIDYYAHSVVADAYLMKELGGKGNIVQVLPTAGSLAAVQEKAALKCVLKHFPNVKLLDAQYGNFNAADSKPVAEAWAQRFPQIDGVVSAWAEQSRGVAQAFDEAGRLDELKFAPANELNGWMKFLVSHPKANAGIVTSPPALGAMAVKQMTKILEGQTVVKGVFIGNRYVPPAKVKSLVDSSKPDTYWPNKMPPSFQP